MSEITDVSMLISDSSRNSARHAPSVQTIRLLPAMFQWAITTMLIEARQPPVVVITDALSQCFSGNHYLVILTAEYL